MNIKKAIYLIFLFSFLNISCALNENSQDKNFFLVKRIIDGDTFVVEDGTKKGNKIRLIGIDAPETRNTGKKKKGFYSKEAKLFLAELINNKKVRLEFDLQSNDKYGRTLAYAYLVDGTFINAELVKQGYAQIATFPPNVKYVDLFILLQQEARNNKRGLWQE